MLQGALFRRLQLHQLLQDLRSGQVAEPDVPVVLRCFGDGFYLDAMDDLEGGVSAAAAATREAAVEVLATRWQLPEHQSLFEFLLRHDADGEVRALAAQGLGAVLSGSRDRDALKLLTQLVADSEQPESVRRAAYYAAFRLVDDGPDTQTDVVAFAANDASIGLRVAALLSEPAATACPRCGRLKVKPGDGPVWCLECAIEMCEHI